MEQKMKSIKKYISFFIIPLSVMMILTTSCKSEEEYPESPDLTVIYEIKILNAGEDGDQVLVGKVDELNKEITFPAVDTLTNFSKIRFEAVLPEGASLDESVYNFSMDGTTRIKRTIAVVNGVRKREYYVTLVQNVPMFGANFDKEKLKVYDFTNNTTIYPDLSGVDTRGMDMDSNYVLVVSRAAGSGPHLLRLSDIKGGKTEKIMLDMTGVEMPTTPPAAPTVTFATSAGRLSHGHIYMCSLSVFGNEESLNFYYWDTPESKPQKTTFKNGTGGILDYIPLNTTFKAGRFGDAMSIDLDENGNGYIFLGNNRASVAAPPLVLRFTVKGFTTISDPTPVDPPAYGGLWTGYNRVDGSDNEYIYSGAGGAASGKFMLVDNSGASIYTMDAVIARGNDARIITYNEERYLVMMSDTKLAVYDITKGSTTQEALTLFEATNKTPRYSYDVTGNSSTFSDVTGVVKTANALYILGAAPGAGFVVIEAPLMVNE
jgi:hypothetical protein